MKRGAASAAVLLALALLAPGTADAKPRLAGTFSVSDTPGQIARGPNGRMWVLVGGTKIARIKPNGNVTEFDPPALTNGVGLTLGRDGNLWATQPGEVVKIPPGDPENGSSDYDINSLSDARRITRGPQGKLWTASGDKLISFTESDPASFEERTIAGMNARGIASGGGKVWIADFGGQAIRRVKPGGGVKTFAVGGGPQEVARGPKKRAAYTNQGTDPHTVGRIAGSKLRKSKVPNTDPFGITFTRGDWWIANFASHNLTILPPKGKPKRFRKLPDNSGPRWVEAGAKRTLWVVLETAQKIARIKGL